MVEESGVDLLNGMIKEVVGGMVAGFHFVLHKYFYFSPFFVFVVSSNVRRLGVGWKVGGGFEFSRENEKGVQFFLGVDVGGWCFWYSRKINT